MDPKLVEDILSKADIVSVISSYLKVEKKGRNYVALCPFHDDSILPFPSRQNGRYSSALSAGPAEMPSGS